MTETEQPASLLRTPPAQGQHRVTFVELFFDLVFVFAVTQISHFLLANLTLDGVLKTSFLMLAVWWVWMFTSWATNWLDPNRVPVRLLLFAMMLAGLLLSTSIPEAFEERDLVFAAAYASMQVGRAFFLWWWMPVDEIALKRNFLRVLIWLSVAGALWVGGGLSDGGLRLALWMTALLLEYISPVMRFWTPGLGASSVEDWAVEGSHMTERCGLFVIIALGESLLVSGATFAAGDWTTPTVLAFILSFISALALWWIYFDTAAEAGSERIAHTSRPGRIARLAYTYLHLPMVAGIIVTAVANELVLAHPTGHTEVEAALCIIGGPLLFLGGALLFKQSIRGWFQPSHQVGLAALVICAPLALVLPPLALMAVTTGLLIAVAVWETKSMAAAGK